MSKVFLEVLRGSVRPVVTYVMAGTVVVGFFLHMVPAELFVPLAFAIINIWFGIRATGGRPE